MKKKVLLFVVAVLTLIATLSLAACNIGINVSGGDASIADDYNAEQTNQRVDALRAGDGYYFRYHIDATGDAEDDDMVTDIALGAKGDIYFVSLQGDDKYFDLGNEEYFVQYEKRGDGEDAYWVKIITYYDDNYTQANAKQSVEINMSFGADYMTYYGAFYEEDGMTKESAKVLGRDCDKYSWGIDMNLGIAKAGYNYACYIDKTTGICLKWNFSVYGNASALGGETAAGEVNFECKDFRTSYTPILPQVEEANIEYMNEPADDEE